MLIENIAYPPEESVANVTSSEQFTRFFIIYVTNSFAFFVSLDTSLMFLMSQSLNKVLNHRKNSPRVIFGRIGKIFINFSSNYSRVNINSKIVRVVHVI